jgi:hypothetical protein
MLDYSKGKIYKIVSGDLTYYGSTCSSLRQRLSNHKQSYEKGNPISSQILFETGYEVKIILVEYFPCANKMELTARERCWIENNDCVNKQIPTRTMKEWRETNRDKLLEQMRQYREAHKEELAAKQAEKIVCECGAVSIKSNILRHKKSKKHIMATTEAAE